MRTKIILIGILIFTVGMLRAKPVTVSSPDKSVNISINTLGGELTYTITKGEATVIEPSLMQWSVNDVLLGDNVSSITQLKTYRENSTYPTRGAHSVAIDNYNGAQIAVGDMKNFTVDVRVFNDGVAFRYLISNNTESTVNDFTTFVIPDSTFLWNQPVITHYEGVYSKKETSKLNVGDKFGCVTTIKYPQNELYATISEAGLLDFGGMSFVVSADRTFKANITGKTVRKDNIDTPWRVVMVGDLNTLANCDIISNVSAQAKFPLDSEWIKPGRGVWSWLIKDSQVSYENMRRLSKLAGELGFEYNLVDEGWSNWGKNDDETWDYVKNLVKCSDSVGVKVWLWKAYPDRAGVEGIYTQEKRRAFFAKAKAAGVVGLKIDFFDDESQEIMNFFGDALADAADFQLMLNFHGANKPAGQSRTYPNEMSREAIRGLENRPAWSPNNTILPFTRMFVGHADFTPVILSYEGEQGNDRQAQRVGENTQAQHFATAVIYASPFLCYAVNPVDLLRNPAKDIVCAIPPVWDETIVLPGSEINQAALFARRSGDTWFVAGTTIEERPDNISLSFLGGGEYECESVNDVKSDQQATDIRNTTVTHKDTLEVKMNKAGGYIAKLTPKK